MVQVVLYDKRPPRPPEPATQRGLNDRWWSLMQTCWLKNPTNRPAMSAVMDHFSLSDIPEEAANGLLSFVTTRDLHDLCRSVSQSMHLCSY